FSAGGPADIYARYLGQQLEKTLGQPVVVENRVGGGGVIGADAVAKAAPDGYTLLMMSNTHTVNESLIVNKPYKLMTERGPARPSARGGQVQLSRVATTVRGKQAGAGKVPPIAPGGRARSAATPGTRTVAEAGAPAYDAVIWLGLRPPPARRS